MISRLPLFARTFLLSTSLAGSLLHAQPVTIVNTGLSSSLHHMNGHWVMQIDEGGSADANQDGDALDRVPALYDLQTLAYTPTAAIHSTPDSALFTPTSVLLQVHETSEGMTDFNGDGDALDVVLQIYDVASGVLLNTGLNANYYTKAIAPDGSLAACRWAEDQALADLNGDGDLSDEVLQLIDTGTGATTNTGYVVKMYQGYGFQLLTGGRLLFAVSEPDHLVDLNGDGDLLDDVAHFLDASSTAPTNLQLAVESMVAFAEGNRAALLVSEAASGQTDLNGDGDATDRVVHLYDPATGISSNTGLASSVQLLPKKDLRVLMLSVSEAKQQQDLNGDGDMSDHVGYVYDPATDVLTNTQLALANSGSGWSKDPDRVTLKVREAAQAQDLNGDGDQQDDVVHVFHLPTGMIHNTGLPIYFSTYIGRLEGGLLAVEVDEAHHGQTDLNGDGDAVDRILVLLDLQTGELRNLQVGGTMQHNGDLAAIAAHESADGVDHTGDGQGSSSYFCTYDVASRTLFDSGLTLSGGVGVGPGATTFPRYELTLGQDLTGDGDTNDVVAHICVPNPGGCGAIAPFGTGCPGANGSIAKFEALGCLVPGESLRLTIRNGTPGELAFLFAGLQAAQLPMTEACDLLVVPPISVSPPLPLAPNGLFLGSFSIDVVLPVSMVAPLSVHLQAFLTSTQPAGFSNTNGVTLHLVP